MAKLAQFAAYLTLLIAFCLMGYIMFNLFYPYPTMVVENPAPVLNKTVHQGEILQIQINCEKFTDKPGTVTRMFVNELIFVMPSYISNYMVGKSNKVSYSTRIPNELPPGEYYIRTTVSYDFPPFRTIVVSFNTEQFEVIK
jgi:hypothetical protein